MAAENTLTDPRQTLRYFERRDRVFLDMLCDFARLDTPTGDVQASRRFASLYREVLESSGLRCREFETEVGVHLVGDWLPSEATSAADDLTPDVTLACHSDTVWPAGEASRRPPTVRDGCLYGPGVYDMKAGLVTAALFFRFLQEGGASTDRHFRICVSADEENGSLDARPFMEQTVPADTCALVLESPLPYGSMKVYRIRSRHLRPRDPWTGGPRRR